MNTLRQWIRQIILSENAARENFMEMWYNVEEERDPMNYSAEGSGSHHRDNLKQLHVDSAGPAIDTMFGYKRDLKKLWNKMIDEFDHRSFWEGPEMKYFHSLSYYGGPGAGVDKLSYSDESDEGIHDLTAHGFFQMYDKTGNKDEMSTYGIYNGAHQIPTTQLLFGVVISGRVTLATKDDAWTESRSKATPKDFERHKGSGMPKRIMPTDDMIDTLLFEEADILEGGKIGECVLDNWSIEAIVCNPTIKDDLVKAAEVLAKQYGVPLLEPKDLGVKM